MADVNYSDVIIVGGGLVGLTCALALAKAGMSVQIIEENRFQPITQVIDYQLRVSAITPMAVRIFQALQVWYDMQKLRVSPFQQIAVWESGNDDLLEFAANSVAQPVLGYIIENQVMQSALFQQVQRQAEIHLISPATLQSFHVNHDHIEIILSDEHRLTAKLLIGADGAKSRVRELAGIHGKTRNYQQQAIVATVQTEKPHNQTARQCFLPTGPLALLPLADEHLCSIVWSHDESIAMDLKNQSQDDFNDALQQAFGNKLGKLQVVSQRALFPLSQLHAKDYVQPRVALMGDAAHVIHPLAGQGVNLGLFDAVNLAEQLVTAHQQRRDIGLLHTLRRYERWRKSENARMLAVTDAFHYLFRYQQTSISRLRQFGLRLTQHCRPVKNHILRQAMGLPINLPDFLSKVES